MHKYKIELVTMSDIVEFVSIASAIDGDVMLIDDNRCCVSGKSLLGAMATVEWGELYCVSDTDIYTKIEKYCVE